MVTPVFICGAECGLVATGTAVPTGALGHWGAVGSAPPTIETTITRGSHSARSLKFNPSAASGDVIQTQLPAAAGTIVARFYIRWTTLPNAIHAICSESSGLHGIRYNPTGTKLEAYTGTTGTGVYAGSFVPSTGVWYRIDVKMVRGSTTWTVDWQVDGAAQTQASKSTQTSGNHTTFRIGNDGGGAAAGAAATATYYVDDIVVSTTSADYPIGQGGVQGLYPNADGTHNYNAATDFKYNNSTNVNGTSSSETGTNANLQNPLSTTVGNFMAEASAGTTEYLAWQFTNLTAAYTAINGVNVVSTHHSSGTTANTQSLRLLDGSTEGVVAALVDWSDTTIDTNNKTFATAPSTAGAWSTTLVNALQVRWGFSTNVATVPYIDGVCLEVEGPISTGVARDLAANVGTATSATSPRVARTETVAVKSATADGAKVTTVNRLRPVVAKAATSTGAKATTITRTRALAAKAGTSSSAKAPSVTRAGRLVAKAATATGATALRLTRAAGVTARAGTADGGTATALRRSRALRSSLPAAAGAHADLRKPGIIAFQATVPVAVETGQVFPLVRRGGVARLATATGARAAEVSIKGQVRLAAKVAVSSSAKGQHRVAYLASGFNVHRPILAKANTAESAFSPGLVATEEGFNVARRVGGKVGTATKASAGLIVAFFGGAGFNVFRPIRARTANATAASANYEYTSEAFRVRRPLLAKVATGSSAKATIITGTVGPGFIVARALVDRPATATSAKAALLVNHGSSLVKLPAAASAKATTLRRGAGMPVRVGTASSARATGRTARPLLARAATASGAKPAFLLTQHAGQKSYAARANTTSSARAALSTAEPLAARSATVSSVRAAVSLRLGLRAKAPAGNSAFAGALLKTKVLGAAHVGIATTARGSLFVAFVPLEFTAVLPTASGARARVNVFPTLVVPGGERGLLVFEVYDDRYPPPAEDIEQAKRHMNAGRLGREYLPSRRERAPAEPDLPLVGG